MPPRPTIAFLIPSLGIGGAERQLLALSGALDPQRWNVVVAHRPAVPGAWDVPAATAIERGPRHRFVPGLRTFLREHSVDLLHAYLLPAQVDAVLARMGGWSGRLVVAVRDALPLWTCRSLMQLAASTFVFGGSRWVDRYVFNSQRGSAAKAALVPAHKRVVIPNGIDAVRFRPDRDASIALRRLIGAPAEAILIGCVANLTDYKDYPTLIEAVRRLPASRGDLRVVIVGDDRAAEADRIQSRAAALEGKVHFLGPQARVETIIPGFDIYCSSSATEGFPNAVAEAMACGVPCVATDAGDSAFLVGDTGLTVPVSDPPELSDALAAALQWSVPERSQRGQAARARIVDRFSIERMVAAHEDLYRVLLRDGEVARPDATWTEVA